MLDTKMQDAINEQINWELYSGYLYLSMAAQFSELGMSGGQNWMTVQYQEELSHAQKMFDYVTTCLLYTSPSPRDGLLSRMPSSA